MGTLSTGILVMNVSENLRQIKARISDAEKQYARTPGSVNLLAVSKTHPPEKIRKIYDAGQKLFGENYVQEAIGKQKALRDCDIEWHFIGSIQSNKTKLIAEHFNWVHSVNCFKIAKRLSEQRPERLPDLNICIEVNISHEATKSGVRPEELLELVSKISVLNRLRLRGLMVIPKHHVDFQQQKKIFDRIAALQNNLIHKGFTLDTLSMGMSDDFEAAIAAGSTIVRLGTTIFGARN